MLIMFFFLLCHYNLFLTVFKHEIQFFLILLLHPQTSLDYHNLEENCNTHFLKHRLVQVFFDNHYIPDFVYKH